MNKTMRYLLVTLATFSLPACEWDFEYELDNIPSVECYTTDKPPLYILIHPFEDGYIEYKCSNWHPDREQWENATKGGRAVKARKVVIIHKLDSTSEFTNSRCTVKPIKGSDPRSLVWTVNDLEGQGV